MRTRTLVPVVAGLLALAAIAVVAGPTYTAVTDGADLVVGAGSAGSPAPSDSPALVTIDPHGVVSRGPAGAPAFVPLPGDDPAVPGRTVRFEVGVADDDPDIGAAVAVAVLPMDDRGTGQLGTTPNATPFLRVTVVDVTTGRILIGASATDPARGVPVGAASAMIGRLDPRGADPVEDGAAWVPGAPGSRHDLDVMVYCRETPAVRALTDPASELAVMLYGAAEP